MPRDDVRAGIAAAEEVGWAEPDMGVLRLHRRPPPRLPLTVFGPQWQQWIEDAADAAACPGDYVVAPLLAAVSALIGNARWPSVPPGWTEPPHLWIGAVGDSGNGKSPGADCLLRDVLPEIERRMQTDFPERHREWLAAVEFDKAREQRWQQEVREAQKRGAPAPLPPERTAGPEPQQPRLRQNDITIEKVASLLATAAPKGLLIIRDELSGWISGMTSYNDAGRAFWVEAYGGRSYRVERQKHPEPIIVPRLAVSVYGGVQPDKLGPLMREADDGLLARILWTWPDPIPFRLGARAPNAAWAIEALDRMRWLEMRPGEPSPIMIPLARDALPLVESFACDMQERQASAGGLMRSALGKARGLALRLSLVLETMWWSASASMDAPPTEISSRAYAGAAYLLTDYYMPAAERVYGDAIASQKDRNAATLAGWIIKSRPEEVYVRHLQRDVRLPALSNAEAIHDAARVLIEADWLVEPQPGAGHRGRQAYRINPRVWEAL